jgi:hypothetical protein
MITNYHHILFFTKYDDSVDIIVISDCVAIFVANFVANVTTNGAGFLVLDVLAVIVTKIFRVCNNL